MLIGRRIRRIKGIVVVNPEIRFVAYFLNVGLDIFAEALEQLSEKSSHQWSSKIEALVAVVISVILCSTLEGYQ
jgi:hypothetical protein